MFVRFRTMSLQTSDSRPSFRDGLSSLLVCLMVFLTLPASAQQDVREGIISGNVMSGSGTEAGVWVIAETDDLPTHYTKIVVTDGQGRFVLPELPDALFKVWVRGYGLVDSDPMHLRSGAEDVKL